MASEHFANSAITTLNGSINNSTTSIVVASAAAFPAVNFRIKIDSEIMLVTGVSGTTLTVTRGAESTSAASHTNGAAVTHSITAGGLAQYLADNVDGGANVGAGVIGSRPAAGTDGNIYIPTDGSIFQRDNGVSWDSFGPVYKFTQPPAAASFTGIVQAGVTLTDQGGTLLLTCPYTTGYSRSAFYIAQTSTWSVTAAFKYTPDGHNGGSRTELGLGFIDTATGQWSFVGYKLYAPTGINFFNIFYDNNAHTSDSSDVTTSRAVNAGVAIPNAGLFWLRIVYGATDRDYYVSMDGVNFQLCYSETRTTNFTPDAAAIIVQGHSGGASNTNLGPNLLVTVFDWH